MEVTCARCHETIAADNCYCAACGLPQLVCTAEAGASSSESVREPVRDASSVDWKAALRAATVLAIPAGLFSSEATPMGAFGVAWMSAAAALAVFFYLRSRRPSWITTGAGARIGLVTGLIGAWLAFGVSAATLFMQRDVFRQGDQIDSEWKTALVASQSMTQQWMAGMTTPEMAQMQTAKAQGWMLSPGGHAGWAAFGLSCESLFLLFFAVAGGALGARMLGRGKRPEA